MNKKFPQKYCRLLIWAFGLIFVLFLSDIPAQAQGEGGFRLSPGRVQLEIPPGGEKTVTLNVLYGTEGGKEAPVRLLTYLNDWKLSESGEISFQKAGTLPVSASSWMIYSPTEAMAHPGRPHTIRVTITVPKDAKPGDHTAALMIEPRTSQIKHMGSGPQVRVSFRLAALFYVTVPNTTRRGLLEGLKADADEETVKIVPTLKNTGNSLIRPTYTLKIVTDKNQTVFEKKDLESMAVLAGAVLSRPIEIKTRLAPGAYKVIYLVNFNDGNPVVEGVTNLKVKESDTKLAEAKN